MIVNVDLVFLPIAIALEVRSVGIGGGGRERRGPSL